MSIKSGDASAQEADAKNMDPVKESRKQKTRSVQRSSLLCRGLGALKRVVVSTVKLALALAGFVVRSASGRKSAQYLNLSFGLFDVKRLVQTGGIATTSPEQATANNGPH